MLVVLVGWILTGFNIAFNNQEWASTPTVLRAGRENLQGLYESTEDKRTVVHVLSGVDSGSVRSA